MPRPKEYDREELLDRSVELFRAQGFSATTTAELVEALGVNRKSMYAEFGSKQELFEATLEHYDRNHLTRVLGPIEAPGAGIDAIRGAFAGYVTASEGWARGKGCLMANTAVERAALDEASGRFVEGYLSRIRSAFVGALQQAKEAGDLEADADVGELAGFLTTALVGVAASIRAEAPSAQLHATSRVVDALLVANGAPPPA
jgi:TetR/AcrR family transcriptional repressor of nem operon